jgi:hypothetical protein
MMKTIQVPFETWKKLKQEALDRDISIWEVVRDLVESYL